MRIVLDLKRDANPQVVLNLLYKHTQLQDTFSIIMLALVDTTRVLNLKKSLFITWTTRKRGTPQNHIRPKQSSERAHILED